MNVIETRSLTKVYGRGRNAKRAVDKLDMHVTEGDIYGFVGKNGAGKSTTMKMIAGLVTPTSGEIELFGAMGQTGGTQTGNAKTGSTRAGSHTTHAPGIFSAEYSRIGALIEEPGVLPGLSAYDNLMAKALAIGVVRAKGQCRDLLNLVGLASTGTKKVKGFSLGMKQRLGLALSLIGSPDLLLLDEPLNGLDPEATRAMRNTLVRLNQERGITIVISSHVLDQLNRVATRFGVVRNGTLVKEFTEAELHAACGSSIRIKTTDTASALAILEERLANANFHAEPDGAVLISGEAGVENVSRILHDAGQTILELSVLERDIEDYFVELMGDSNDSNGDSPQLNHGGERR